MPAIASKLIEELFRISEAFPRWSILSAARSRGSSGPTRDREKTGARPRFASPLSPRFFPATSGPAAAISSGIHALEARVTIENSALGMSSIAVPDNQRRFYTALRSRLCSGSNGSNQCYPTRRHCSRLASTSLLIALLKRIPKWGDDTKVRKLSGSRSYSDARALSNWS